MDKLESGNFRPKSNIFVRILVPTVLVAWFCIALYLLWYGWELGSNPPLIVALISIFCSVYIALISVYTQKSSDYYIEFEDNKLDGFKLKYKNLEVTILYKLDDKGKFEWENRDNKIACINYTDEQIKMSNLTKTRIINYFMTYLNSYGMLSDNEKISFKKKK